MKILCIIGIAIIIINIALNLIFNGIDNNFCELEKETLNRKIQTKKAKRKE